MAGEDCPYQTSSVDLRLANEISYFKEGLPLDINCHDEMRLDPSQISVQLGSGLSGGGSVGATVAAVVGAAVVVGAHAASNGPAVIAAAAPAPRPST